MIDTTPLSKQAEQALKNEILSGNLTPGQRIDLPEYAAAWGISITPLRDACRVLQTVGLIEVSPRRGVFVATPSRKMFRDIFHLRIALECMAVQLATLLIPEDLLTQTATTYRHAYDTFVKTGDRKLLVEHDHDIHDLVVNYSDNPRLIEIMQDLQDMVTWTRLTVIQRVPESYKQAAQEHLRIYEALEARDTTAAVEAMRIHLQSAFERTYAYLEPDAPKE